LKDYIKRRKLGGSVVKGPGTETGEDTVFDGRYPEGSAGKRV